MQHVRHSAVAIAVAIAVALLGCGDNLKPTLSVTPSSMTVPLGGTQQISAELGGYIPPEGLESTGMTWSIDDPTVAQLATNASGAMITGLQVGSTTAHVKCIGQTVDVPIEVTQSQGTLVSVDIQPNPVDIPLGLSVPVAAYATYSDGTRVNVTTTATWTIDDASIASTQQIQSAGTIAALAAGTTTLHAAFDNVTGSAPVDVTSATLMSLQITPPSLTLPVGTSAQLHAVGTYSDGTVIDLTGQVAWASGTTSVATITTGTGGGIATAVAPGTSTITATLGAVSATATVTVTSASVVSIAIIPAAPILPVGHDLQLHAAALLSDGTTIDVTDLVTWTSAGPAVATVSATGELAGMSIGITVVTAKLGAVTAAATVTVTAAALDSIEITPASSSLPIGLSEQLTATGTFSDGTKVDLTNQVAWTSSATATASISNVPAGLVTAHAAGTATITATAGAISGTATVTVTNATLASITITAPTTTLPLGTTEQLTATGLYSDGTTHDLTTQVTWSSSAPLTVAVSNFAGSQGTAAALSLGTATISAALGGVSGSIAITATNATLASVDVSPATLGLAAGTTGQLTATALFSDGTTLDVTGTAVWTTSNPGTASVTAGAVTAGAVGAATITASYGAHSGSAAITVTAATLSSIQISPATLGLPLGASGQLTATGIYSDGTHQDLTNAATWTTSAAAIASVSNTPPTAGLVTANGIGTATVTAAVGGASATATVTVGSATLKSIQISPASLTLPIGTSGQLTATGVYTDGTSLDLTAQVAWTSNAALVASVGAAPPSSGLVTAHLLGAATITATLGAVSASVPVNATGATLTSIQITPSSADLPVGVTVPFFAIGVFSDGTHLDMTAAVAWASSAPAIASVSNAPFAHGLVTANAIGTAIISATFDGVTGTGTVVVTPALPTGIVVTPALVTMPAGSVVQLTATAFYTDGTNADVTAQVTWTSVAPLIASVSNSPGTAGQVKGNGVLLGTTTVAAQLGPFTAGAQVVVTALLIEQLQLAPTALAIPNGATGQLHATAVYSDDTKADVTALVTCTSSAPAIAAVSDGPVTKGLVVARGIGAATVTCSLAGQSATASIDVTNAALASIAIDPPMPVVHAGVAMQLTATGVYSDGTTLDLTPLVTWSTSNAAVATVSNAAGSAGKLTAVGPGSATATAQLGAVSASIPVTVSPATLTGIQLGPIGLILPQGLSTPLLAVGVYSDGTTADLTASVTWSTSDTGVVQVSNVLGIVGIATASGVGTATVKAQIGPIQAELQIEVTAAILQSITINVPTIDLPVGLSIPAVALGVLSDGSTLDLTSDVAWLSSDLGVAAVTNLAGVAGLVTAKAPGDVTITAKLLGVTATVNVKVVAAILQSIAISGDLDLALGGSTQLTAIGTFSDGSTLDVTAQASWSTVNGLVALVSDLLGKTGLVTPIAIGTVQVKAVLAGIVATANLTVEL